MLSQRFRPAHEGSLGDRASFLRHDAKAEVRGEAVVPELPVPMHETKLQADRCEESTRRYKTMNSSVTDDTPAPPRNGM